MAKKKSKVKDAKEDSPKLYFAVRIRGAPGMNRKILDTLGMLRNAQSKPWSSHLGCQELYGNAK